MSYFISVVLFGGDLILFQRSSVQVIRKKHFLQLSLFIFTLAFLFLLLKITFSTAVAYEAKQTVHRFYQYESEGRFSESWELFHSLMKEKFSKGYYIQESCPCIHESLRCDNIQLFLRENNKNQELEHHFLCPAFKSRL